MFWKCLELLEIDDDEDDFGVLVVVGCLRVIGIILEFVSWLFEIYFVIELIFFFIM